MPWCEPSPRFRPLPVTPMSDLDTLQEAIERSDKSLAEWTAIRRKHTQRALFRDVDAKAVADAVVDKRPEPAENELE